METPKIFISVGATSTKQQEDFVKSIEDRLISENLIPNTVGRNLFGADSPLKTVKKLMDECSGAIIIALERTYFEKGKEKRGSENEINLSETKIATPWNQIESAMAYSKGLPILVIKEEGVREEGLLEKGYDWYVITTKPVTNYLSTTEFNGILASWKNKIREYQDNRGVEKLSIKPEELTIGEITKNMKPAQLWGVLAAVIGLMIGIFIIGQNFPIK